MDREGNTQRRDNTQRVLLAYLAETARSARHSTRVTGREVPNLRDRRRRAPARDSGSTSKIANLPG